MFQKILISLLLSCLMLTVIKAQAGRYAPGQIIIKYEKTGQRARGSEILSEHQNFVDNLKLNMNGLKIKSYSPIFSSIIKDMIDKNYTEQELTEKKIFSKKNKTILSLIKKTTFSNTLLLKIDSVQDMVELASSINNNPDILASQGIRIVYAEPNYLKRISISSNDPLYPLQWSHKITNMEKAWDTMQGSPDIKIAIIDTGVDPTHPDLMDNLLTGYNFVNIDINYYQKYYTLLPGEIYNQPGTNCTDYNGHGTHCAGIAAATGNNGIGVIGVAPKCKIMPVRAGFSILINGQETGVLETTAIVQAINYAVENGADVISMSFGGDSSNVEKEAIQNAYYNNVVMVAAAGNSNSTEKSYPAGYNEVLAITSIDSTRARSSYSNYGLWTSVAAPGENIISTVPLTGGGLTDHSGYKVLSGTSMASPYVAGVAALVLSHNPTMSNNLVYQTIRSSVNSYYSSSYYIGTGIVDGSKIFSGAEACISKITAPHNISNVYISQGSIDIAGRASGKYFSKYSFEYSDYENPNPVWQAFGQNYTTSVDSGYLGTVNITQSGVYYIRLRVTSTANTDYTDIIGPITVDKRLKANWTVSTGYTIGSTPVLADIDGDGKVETIFTSSNGLVYVVDQNGNNKPGWPQTIPKTYQAVTVVAGYCSPAVGDLDNNGKQEIAVRDGQFIYVYNNDGSMKSGWPVSLGPNIFAGNAMVGSPTIADINNDGYKEILVTFLDGKIFAFNRNGQTLAGWPVILPLTYTFSTLYSTPVVSDLKGDGNSEIIIQCYDASTSVSTGYIYVFDKSGNILHGWPQIIGGGSWTTPIAVDINNDGQNEIIASSFLQSGTYGTIGIYAFSPAGITLKGFPVKLNDLAFGYYSIASGLAAGDINNDGYKEIISASSQNQSSLFAIDRNGKILWTSPVSEAFEFNQTSVPIIADINNDGKPEILVSKYNNINQSGKILVVNNTGQIIPNLSCVLPEEIRATPSIGNIEGNKQLELICGTEKGNVFCWELGASFDSTKLIWPTYQQNYQRTGSIDQLREVPGETDLVMPINNAIFQAGAITFSWNPVAAALKYHFQLSDSSSFNNIIFEDSTVGEVYITVDSVQNSMNKIINGVKYYKGVSASKKTINSESINKAKKEITALNDGINYYWRVAAVGLAGTGQYSKVNSFSTILNTPETLLAKALPSEKITLNWTDKSNGNIGNIIERKLSTDNNYTVIDTLRSDTVGYTDTTLTSINTYKYRVRAYNQFTVSAYSNEVTIKTLPPLPSLPALTAPLSNLSDLSWTLDLSWVNADNADSYRLQISKDSTFKTFFLNDSTITSTSRQVSGLEDGIKYYWRVSSKNAAGVSPYSEIRSFSTLLNTPGTLTAQALPSEKIVLNWADKSNNNIGYIIERKLLFDSSYTVIDTTKMDIATYTDTTLKSISTFTYRIKAYNKLDISLYSNEITIKTIPSYPASPILSDPLISASNQPLNLSWSSSALADSYRLQVSIDSAFNTFFLNDSTITATTRQVTGLEDGIKYYWRVSSRNAAGVSPYSEVRSFTTLLNAPGNLAATALWGYKVSLSWSDASKNESGYVIERALAKDSIYALIDTVKSNVLSYTDSSLTSVNTYYYRVKAYNALGSSVYGNVATVSTITAVENKYSGIPTRYEVLQNYPNPFNPTTVIEYGLPVQSQVKIVVYNILGAVVKELANTVQSAGYHNVNFGGNNISSGVYFYKVEAKALDGSKQFREIKKMMLLK